MAYHPRSINFHLPFVEEGKAPGRRQPIIRVSRVILARMALQVFFNFYNHRRRILMNYAVNQYWTYHIETNMDTIVCNLTHSETIFLFLVGFYLEEYRLRNTIGHQYSAIFFLRIFVFIKSLCNWTVNIVRNILIV